MIDLILIDAFFFLFLNELLRIVEQTNRRNNKNRLAMDEVTSKPIFPYNNNINKILEN